MSGRMFSPPKAVLTVGHSNRPLEAFLRLLQAHGAILVVDVRKMPGSRRNPQFGRDNFPQALQQAGIGYVHMPGLGGLRRRRSDSPNTGWKNASFQGYADYMLTPEFESSLQELLERAGEEQVALTCAEAVPWRCHRSLVADALVARGVTVEHILGASRTQAHTLRPWARVQGTRIIYPPPAEDGGQDVSGH
jgi:uncharacterized protein (DUF488 family)